MEMGYAWHATTAAFDAGIDGFIELRDRATHEALNLIVQVQVKSTGGKWPGETDASFEFLCEERDLAYWRKGNAPVVLVVTRPDTNEAYWVSIKEYFKGPAQLKARRVHFNKKCDRFDASSAEALKKLAVRPDAGLFSAPLKKHEWLFSNLLTVTRLPERLFAGDTALFGRRAVWSALGDLAQRRAEYVYRGKRILTVHDLREPEWKDVVDRGTVESFDTVEWALSDDGERLDDFTELLGRCLSERVYLLGLRYNQDRAFYYFRATKHLGPRVVSYTSMKQRSKRTVFQKYETQSGYVYYRHTAFEPQFRRYDGTWYLDITPTYHFTADGHAPLKFYETKLRGIKALEKNATVLNHVVFFASILADRDEGELFESTVYPFLGFGPLLQFQVDVGISDETWLPTDEDKQMRANAAADEVAIASEDESLPQLPFDEEPTA